MKFECLSSFIEPQAAQFMIVVSYVLFNEVHFITYLVCDWFYCLDAALEYDPKIRECHV